jgi:hypothetical protein
MFSGGVRRARIHAEKQKKKKLLKKSSKKVIPQKKTFGFRLPTSVRQFLGIKDDANPDLPSLGTAENNELKALSFGFFEKITLLEIYREMCGPNSKAVSYRAFCMYFKIQPDKWIHRVFDLINSQVTGSFSLLEFIQFVGRYLYIDVTTTEEFCFRLLSRRGLSFMPLFSILDLDDFVTFISLRYRKISRLPKQRKIAMEMLIVTDENGDGGVSFQEFQDYCRRNPVFLKLSHPIQNHLRKCIFGMEFWVDKSRTIRTSRSSALIVMASVGGRINREAEMYTLKHIGDPVIDKNGYALRTKQKPPRDDEEDSNSDRDSDDEDDVQTREEERLAAEQLNAKLATADNGGDMTARKADNSSVEAQEMKSVESQEMKSVEAQEMNSVLQTSRSPTDVQDQLSASGSESILKPPETPIMLQSISRLPPPVKEKDLRRKLAYYDSFSVNK